MINKKYTTKNKIRASLLLVLLMLISTLQLTAQVFDSNGTYTYTVPAGVTSVKVHAWGGGGAGGARSSNGRGGGGGAGAYSYEDIPVTPGQVFTIRVGSGGTTGSTGEDSYVTIGGTTRILAKGGSGVANNTTGGGLGGRATGGIGSTRTNGGDGSNASTSAGGNGGDSPNGGNGGAGATSNNTNGTGGSAPGGGGGGARRTSGNRTGGTGGAGRIEIETSAIEIANLEIPSMTPNKTEVNLGDEITYTVKARNNGPSAVDHAPFSFRIPGGFDPKSISFSGEGCGMENMALTYDALSRTYNSTLALPNGCEVEYIISMDVASNIDVGYHEFLATVVPPNDVTDPDDTNNIKRSLVSYSIASLCYDEILGKVFQWDIPSSSSASYSQTITQPGTNAGFTFDIYELDNSFNMEINGTNVSTEEIQFQKSSGLTQNVRFADGSIWEADGIEDIWKLRGITNKPIVRILISPLGNITMLGSKVSASNAAYELVSLELFGTNNFNIIHWNSNSENTIKISQKITGVTVMDGFGYGRDIASCDTYTLLKEGVFNDVNKNGIAQPGETITYTLSVINAGDIPINNVKVNDPMLGGEITVLPTGDGNNNGILDTYETWVYTVTHVLTQADISAKGVYNLATVTGKNEWDEDLDPVTSVDPTPLSPTDPNYDVTHPDHTFVPLKGRTLLITNPNIYQRVKSN